MSEENKKPAYAKFGIGGSLVIAGIVLLFTGQPTIGVAVATLGVSVLQGKRILENTKKVIEAVKKKPKK